MVLVRTHTLKGGLRRRSRLRSLSRQEHMQELLEERQRTERQTLDKFFDEYDENDSKDLDRTELKHLIRAMQPGQDEPSEEAVDNIMRAIHAASAYREQMTPRKNEKPPFSSIIASVSSGLHSPRWRRASEVPIPEDGELPPMDRTSSASTRSGKRRETNDDVVVDDDQQLLDVDDSDAAPPTQTQAAAMPDEAAADSPAKASSSFASSSSAAASSVASSSALDGSSSDRGSTADVPRDTMSSDGTARRQPLPISKDQLRMAIQQNLLLCKEQQYLDNIFNRYDEDKSGYLEPSEVKSLMQAAAHGDVLHFDDTHECAQEAACISYKLKCLDDMKRKGVINDKVWRDKRANIAKRHQSIMSPRLSERDPDDADLAFVLSQCDKNNDGRISRDELFMAIGLWIQVSHDADQRRNSAVCIAM